MNHFQRTRAALEQGVAENTHPGAQIYVSRDGLTLLDEAFGFARENVPMRRDSVTAWFSAGKPLTAIAIGQLVEHQRLAWETRVAEIVPEFAQHGKDAISVQHLLTHTAGLRSADGLLDSLSWEEKIAEICRLPPEPDWVPGARAAYHVSGTWYLLGELVRRISGRSLDEFLAAHIFPACGMTLSSLALSLQELERRQESVAYVYDTTDGHVRPKEDWNSPSGLTRCRPGGSARGPIRDLGRFYEMLLNGGAEVLRPATVAHITARHRTGLMDETFQYRMDWGLGFILNSNRDGVQMPYGYGREASFDTFGHSGNQASCAFADPAHRLVVAWACNGMPGERKHQQRQRAINNAIYEDLGLKAAEN